MIKHEFGVVLTPVATERRGRIMMSVELWNDAAAGPYVTGWLKNHFAPEGLANGAHLRVSFGFGADDRRRSEWRRSLTAAECEPEAFWEALKDAVQRAHTAYEVLLEVRR